MHRIAGSSHDSGCLLLPFVVVRRVRIEVVLSLLMRSFVAQTPQTEAQFGRNGEDEWTLTAEVAEKRQWGIRRADSNWVESVQ